MSERLTEAVLGPETPTTELAEALGTIAQRITDLSADAKAAKDTDTARWQSIREEQQRLVGQVEEIQGWIAAKKDADQDQAVIEVAEAAKAFLANTRLPAKGIGGGPQPSQSGYERGSFLWAVHEAAGRDADRQTQGKALLAKLAERFDAAGDAKAATYQIPEGKATLGSTDATGGWIIPNAVVDEFIKPASFRNIYRTLCTSVPGVTGAAVDIPYRNASPARALVSTPFGSTKENVDLVYAGYTATMYTIARIHDVSNQFLRQSRGAAEADVMGELATAFALGESYYVREGSGTSEPFGYTTPLTNGPPAFRTTAAPAASLAGSISTHLALAAGALAGRGHEVRDLSAVLAAVAYFTMLSEGTDTAGFFFNPASGPTGINAPPGTLVSPFGIPVYPDSAASNQATAAVLDNLVVGDWKRLKVYFGQSYRVDSSDQAGTRWDTNLTGFRGEEEMGCDARPAVYAGHFQMVTDILP